MFVRACPRPMHNVLCAGTIEARALWIRTRESGISLRRWRRLCHGGPPVVRNGPKDTDLTPVAPRYCSPGLPEPLVTYDLIGINSHLFLSDFITTGAPYLDVNFFLHDLL